MQYTTTLYSNFWGVSNSCPLFLLEMGKMGFIFLFLSKTGEISLSLIENGRMISNFLLSKMEGWFSNMFSIFLSYLASGQWLIMVLSLQRSFIVLFDDTFFPAAIVVKLLLKLWCFHLSLAASQMQSFRQHCTTLRFHFLSTWLDDWKNGKLVTPSDVIATSCHSAENMGKSAKHNQVCQGNPPLPVHTFYEGASLCWYMERG